MAPAVKATLPQPGLQRRWTALDGEDVSDGGDPYTGDDCSLPLVDDLRGGFAKLSADAPWQCPRSQTRDDLRSGFAWNEPLIAAKLSVAIADHTGTIVERYAYSAFGMPSILTPAFEPRSSNQSDFDWNLLFHAEFADNITGWLRTSS